MTYQYGNTAAVVIVTTTNYTMQLRKTHEKSLRSCHIPTEYIWILPKKMLCDISDHRIKQTVSNHNEGEHDYTLVKMVKLTGGTI